MAERKPATFYLFVTSWAGITFMAKHYYGSIKDKDGENLIVDGRRELTRPLSSNEAKELNKSDGVSLWRAGMRTGRFNNAQTLVASAKRWFFKNARPGDKLVKGNPWVPEQAITIAKKTRRPRQRRKK